MLQAGLPNITGVLGSGNGSAVFYSPAQQGAFKNQNNAYAGITSNSDANERIGYINFNASWSNNIYGHDDTVQPPAIALIPQIRY